MKKWIILILIIILSSNKGIQYNQDIVIYYPESVSIYDIISTHIKEFEELHINNKYYIGYGHRILNKNDHNITNFDSLLIIDLKKNISEFSMYKDSIPLGILSYNIGCTRLRNSGILKVLHIPLMRDSIWLSYIYHNGKLNKRMLERRKFEINLIK